MRTGERYVYRLFDSAGTCLYVGECENPLRRIARHRQRPWGTRIADVVMTLCADRIEGLALENAERRRLSPEFSIDRNYSDKSLGHGELSDWVVRFLAANGPATQKQIGDQLVALGWQGSPNSIGSVVIRLVDRGSLVIAGEVPSSSGRWKTARLFGLAEQSEVAA